MMKSFRLSRRTVLRAAGGGALALPVLDAMLNSNGDAYAQGGTAPRRFILCFGGHSLGSDTDQIMPETYHLPKMLGPNYDITDKVALQPLASVKGHVTIVRNLRIPSSGKGQAPPPGGWSPLFHENARR